jgi:hypothetical protein
MVLMHSKPRALDLAFFIFDCSVVHFILKQAFDPYTTLLVALINSSTRIATQHIRTGNYGAQFNGRHAPAPARPHLRPGVQGTALAARQDRILKMEG